MKISRKARKMELKKIRKIKALAERGEGKEKEAALKLYNLLVEKYNIDDNFLAELEVRWFRYKDCYEEKLLRQISYMVTGSPVTMRWTGRRANRKEIGIECTELEFAEIELNYAFYKKYMKEELDKAYGGFIISNNLYPDEKTRCYKEDDTDTEFDDEEIEAYFEKKKFAEIINKRIVPRFQIEDNS